MKEKAKEREHHPFGPSRLDSIKLCPAKHKMELGLAEIEVDKHATRGRIIHELLSTYRLETLPSDLDEDYLTNAKIALEETGKLIQTIFGDGFFEDSREVKLNCYRVVDRDKEEQNLLYFGYADFVANDGEHLLVIDYKFGKMEVLDPSYNLQMKAYALAAMQQYGLRQCTVAIIQPEVGSYVKTAMFDDWRSLYLQIVETIERGKNVLEFNPGIEACRYCKAKAVCPALKDEIMDYSDIKDKLIDDSCLYNLYKQSRVWKKMVSDIEAITKAKCIGLAEDGLDLYGISAREMEGREYLVNNLEFFATMMKYLNWPDVTGDITVSRSTIAKKWAEAYIEKHEGCELKKALQIFNDLTKDCFKRSKSYYRLFG
jgi:hypothetical protein